MLPLVWEIEYLANVGIFVLPLVWEIEYLVNVGTFVGKLNRGKLFPIILGVPCRLVGVGLV